MKNFLLISFCLLLITRLTGQEDHFIFKKLDAAIINFWLAETQDVQVLLNLENDLLIQWNSASGLIDEKQFSHFDKVGFLHDQDKRLKYIHELLSRGKYKQLEKELLVFLTEFKEVRECFTDDFYLLDELLTSYQAYLSVHEIIHDELMGLYEWTEFIWYVDQLKCKVEELEVKFSGIEGIQSSGAIQHALSRLNTCLASLDDSLGEAYRPDFEVPCNELQLAFADLFKAYNKTYF